MTETFYRTGTHKIDNSTFGGVICFSDFNTNYRGKENIGGSFIASRIVADWKFDKKCRENRESNNISKNRRRSKNA